MSGTAGDEPEPPQKKAKLTDMTMKSACPKTET
jgi:hypothetical protein